MEIVAEHPDCELSESVFPRTRATKNPEDWSTTLVLSCPPAGVPGQVGWWCESDADRGNDGYLCDSSTHGCVPSSCAFSAECNPASEPAVEGGVQPVPLVCDPGSRACMPSVVCSDCGDDEVCVGEPIPGWRSSPSVCVPACEFYEPDACGAGAQCDGAGSYDPINNALGAHCVPAGDSGSGAACVATEVSTGCVSGFLCAGGACRRPCDLYSADPSGCEAGERCGYELVPSDGSSHTTSPICTADPIDPAEVCTTSDWRCADDGARALGICAEDGICRSLCTQPNPNDPQCGTCTPISPNDAPDPELAQQIPRVGLCRP
ncbi:hypothetical protein DB30_07001 [Enhygromyxa salina]|uniref:Uncharacterized protein n=1 Tax=Enhygromyxa salina TaxID=215803 RepID=A0A0C2D289_9BACT|nr:hypothetical protein [Enhygromyxa salina]KIG14252.1 hypothetical protein DB30_07001 [Enhygromyxa salina]